MWRLIHPSRAPCIVSGLALVAGTVLGSGCASVTGAGSARTLSAGEQEFASGIELGLALPEAAPGQRAPLLWPQIVLGYRRGFTERLDAGARLWGFAFRNLVTIGGEVDTKIALRKADRLDRGVDLTLAPSLGYHQANHGVRSNFGHAPGHSPIAYVPLLIGLNLPGAHQIVFGPRAGYQGLFRLGQRPVHMSLFGSTFGLAAKWNETVTLFPEVAFLHSPGLFVDDRDRNELTIVQFAFGMRFSL